MLRPMAGRTALLLGLGLLVFTTLFSAIEFYLELTQPQPVSDRAVVNVIASTAVVLPPLGFSIMGFIVVWRRVKNRVGWVMCGIGIFYAIGVVTTDFPVRAYSEYHLRGAVVLIPAVIGHGIWGLFVLCLASLLLLYPTGSTLSSRWNRVLTWGVPLALAILIIGAFAPFRLSSVPLRNPLALSFVPAGLGDTALLPCAGVLLLSVAGMVLRFRHSRGEVRQQMKWFTYSAAFMVVFFLATVDFGSLLGAGYFVTLSLMPVAIGIAVLKYRLWDIDVLINRTLVYVSLTVTLGGLYILGVIVLQLLFRALTGQTSDLAIAAVTLAVAALFNPWRHRLQTWIDRRFYRRKYDAARTLAALGARLRNDMDLPQVTADITSAVHETMQPAHLTIWLR